HAGETRAGANQSAEQPSEKPNTADEWSKKKKKQFCFTSERSPVTYEYSWLHRHCTSAQTHHRRAQGSGRLFSGLLTVNVVFLGAALISSVILSQGSVPAQDFQILLSVLMFLSSGWMLYHILCTRRKTHAVLKDHHAGALWLRVSLVLFGICSLLLSIFKIGYDLTLSCKLPLEIIFSCVEILFISICGIMLTLATNLLFWFLSVFNDSVHREQEGEETNTTSGSSCLCPTNSLCQTFHRGYVTLYPFNLEYSLVCASMLFIMWKNVGRIRHNPFDVPHSAFRLRGVVYGPLVGIAVLLVGVCVFVQYQIQVSVGTAPPASYLLYYGYSITVLPAMIICCAIGVISLDQWRNRMQSSKNYTRSLEIVLLLGAALGPFSISYYSIVAILATDPWKQMNSLNLAYSILMIAQHILQNIFIIECMRGEGGEATHPVTATDEPGEEIEPPRRMSLVEMRRVSLAYLQSVGRLSVSRRTVKEIALFLVLCNIMFWIMSAFGNHPQDTNGVEREFYGSSVWFSILNFGLPLSVFYRMHSVGALLGVYMNT
uniref:Otopetrin 3 n=1 Tax=Leptobrachium leishanense TaxID=445787 RepID=A0A8C5WLV1_9ANUR